MKIILEKTNENKIYYIDNDNKIELKVNKQQSKGEGKEVVDIEKFVGEQWQKWVSLSRLIVGENEIELKPRKELTIDKYSLTKEEEEEIKQLENRINEIKENARKRVIPKLDLNKINNQEYLDSLTIEQKQQLKEVLTRIVEGKRG